MENGAPRHLNDQTCASSSYYHGKCPKPNKMEPESILAADWLDLLFEHQNKEYGAYPLRKGYPARLAKSLGLVMLLPIALFMLNLWDPRFFSGSRQGAITPLVEDSLRIIEVVMPKPIPIKAQPPSPRPVRAVQPTHDLQVPVLTRPEAVPLKPTEEPQGVQPGPAGPSGGLTGLATPGEDSGLGTEAGAGTKPAGGSESPLGISEIMPEYPGGLQALSRFLTKNLHAPKTQEDSAGSVRVLVQFIVDKTGQISGAEILQSRGEDFDREVMRVVHKMPAWRPGMQNGQRVCVYFRLPVIFQMTTDN